MLLYVIRALFFVIITGVLFVSINSSPDLRGETDVMAIFMRLPQIWIGLPRKEYVIQMPLRLRRCAPPPVQA